MQTEASRDEKVDPSSFHFAYGIKLILDLRQGQLCLFRLTNLAPAIASNEVLI